ncbi:MAG: UbiA prenyltransferase family protein [Fimbriimonadaceae bacterium]
MGAMKAAVRLVRPKQWSKNLLVLAAWIFAGKVGDPVATGLVLRVFFGMCLASSAVYVFNDLLDAERDRNHPEKRQRPIASGEFPVPWAAILGAALLVGAFALVVPVNKTSTAILLFYLALQVLYNVWAKRVPILDVFIIAAGFVARAVIGASAIQVTIGAWLLVCTGTLAMMLGYAKRRHELMLQGDGAFASRASLGAYNRTALDALVVIFAAQAMISYGVYSIESTTATQHPALIITTPLVIYGLARYLLLVFVKEEGGEPADILTRDPHILASIVLFGIAATAAMNGLVLPFLER